MIEFPKAKGIVVSGDIHGDFNGSHTPSLTYWFYGHFHESWHSEIEGVKYNMLDCMELREIR